ncbi:MAG: serine hydrolase domain-containing protein [Thermomicrobiales bacterium]
MPSSAAAPPFDPDGLDRLDATLRWHAESGGVPGIVAAISRHGQRHLAAAGTLTLAGPAIVPDAIFRIASITKPIAATAAMILVEEGRIGLDASIDNLLPELVGRPVLRTLASDPDDTVPAFRPVTTRDLLTFTGGDGYLFAAPGTYPIQAAIEQAGLSPAAPMPGGDPDSWIARLGTLPLLSQPGHRWRYHVSAEILGVLIARAARQPLPDVMQERIFAPLGMRDTGFQLPAASLDRFTTCYQPGPTTAASEVYDPAQGSAWLSPPSFPNAGGDLLSTADDLLAFGEMLAGRGERAGVRVLSPESVAMMTTDHLTDLQKTATGIDRDIFGIDGWGFCMNVHTRPTSLGMQKGTYGWDGGLGTSWANDPVTGLTGVLLTNLAWTSPTPPAVRADFWRTACMALA